MINMPTTDILTPISGEVDKTLSTDHSDAAEVSFLSVITTEDANTDALAAVSSLPLPSQTHSKIQAEFVGLAAALPAFMPVPGLVASPLSAPLAFQNIDAETPSVSALPLAVISKDGGDAGLALSVDKRQTINAAVPSLGVDQKPNVDGAGLIPVTSATAEMSLALKDGTAAVAAKTEPTLVGSDPRGAQVKIDQRPQYNVVGSTQARKTAQTMPAPQNVPANMSNAAPVAAPVNAVLNDVKQSEKTSVFSDRPQMISAVGNVVEQSQKPTMGLQKTSFASDARAVDAEPMNIQAKPATKDAAQGGLVTSTPRAASVQNFASAPVQPRPDGPLMGSGMPDTAKVSAPLLDAPIIASSPTSPEMPIGNTKTPVPESPAQINQAQINQVQINQVQVNQVQPKRIPSRPAQAAQVPSVQPLASQQGAAELTPHAPVTLFAETRSAKQNDQASAVPQTRTPIKGSRTQPAQSTDITTMTPMAATGEIPSATPTIDALESLSTPEILPFDVRWTDSTMAARNDTNVNRPEVMRHAAQQLADAARQMPDRPIELALNPEELGRVRLTFTPTENGIHIAVMAERSETMDLLRRHIETLAQEFREMGYKDVNFEFSQNGQNEAQNEDSDGQAKADPESTSSQTQTNAPIQLSLEPSTGLDLRL